MVGEFNVVYLILAEYHALYETIVVESKTACDWLPKSVNHSESRRDFIYSSLIG